jgi:hypothetical protein
MNNTAPKRRRQNLGYAIGITVGLVCLGILLAPSQEKLHVRGPMNTGHEEFKCTSCHKPARGTLRQQLQANVRYLLGLREMAADFGQRDVTSEICLECHDRPKDRHPVYRFLEPRFAKARANLQPQFCISCHLEHHGRRVTRREIGYCVNCHKDTKLKNDPITISHADLITAEHWESCLGCHDFHGNHVMKTKTVVKEAFTPEQIRIYFEGGPSPYPKTLYYKAQKETTDG